MKQKEQAKQQACNTVSQKDEAIIVMKQVKEVEAEVLSMKELKDAVEKSSDQEALSAKKQVIDNMNTQPVQTVCVYQTTSSKFGLLLLQLRPLQINPLFLKLKRGLVGRIIITIKVYKLEKNQVAS